jgi:hypothetical protein
MTFATHALFALWKDRCSVVLMSACIAAVAYLQACSGRQESSYTTLDDAIKAGEITRGWIPDYLPRSSHAIRITYDPSSPRTWCAFEFSPAAPQDLKKNLTSVSVFPEDVKHLDDPGLPWWPRFLKGDIDVAKVHEAGFDAYVTEEPAIQSSNDVVLFAIRWADGRGFFYRTPAGSRTTR